MLAFYKLLTEELSRANALREFQNAAANFYKTLLRVLPLRVGVDSDNWFVLA